MYYILAFIVLFLLWLSIRPSNNRRWSEDQAILPHAQIRENSVSISNVRNFLYSARDKYTPRFYDRTYDLSELTHLYYMVVPFSRTPGVAHSCVSFEFSTGEYIAISVEVRKKIGESYSLLKSLIKGYELMYVVADERDIIKLRTDHRDEKVHLYKLELPKDVIQKTFVDMLERANTLRHAPEFYNPITNTCTNNIIQHINKFLSDKKKIPLHISAFLPRWSDAFFYRIGLIKNDRSFEEKKRASYINDRARSLDEDDPEFSQKIRI